MDSTAGVDLAAIGRGLGSRLRDLDAALVRYDGFVIGPAGSGRAGGAETGPDAASSPDQPEDRLAAARWLVLAALRAAADPAGWELLARLREADTSTGQLAKELDRPRVVVWEQVNGLVQAGLVARAPDLDVVGLTAAGMGVVDLVEQLATAAVVPS